MQHQALLERTDHDDLLALVERDLRNGAEFEVLHALVDERIGARPGSSATVK